MSMVNGLMYLNIVISINFIFFFSIIVKLMSMSSGFNMYVVSEFIYPIIYIICISLSYILLLIGNLCKIKLMVKFTYLFIVVLNLAISLFLIYVELNLLVGAANNQSKFYFIFNIFVVVISIYTIFKVKK